MGYCTRILRHGLILDVHDDCIETIGWWITYYCILVQMDDIDQFYMSLSIEYYPILLLYSCYWKLLGKYCQIVTHVLFHCSTIYTVISFTLLLLPSLTLLLSPYRLCNRNNMDIDWFKYIWTTYTGIGEIDGDNDCILGGPRMQIAQLRYSSIAGFRGMTDIPYCFHYYCYCLPSGRTCFNANWLGRGSRYVRNPPKAWIMSLLLVSIT